MKIVIAGSSQTVSHWTPQDGPGSAPSPHSLRLAAARSALTATLTSAAHTPDFLTPDVLAVIRTTDDSVPTSTHPHGRNANPPGTLARDLGITPRELHYSAIGGQTPQALVNHFAARIANHEIASALIVGAEATGASKSARRAGLTLDWTDDAPAAFTDAAPDLASALDWLDPDELRHGLLTPAQYYGLVESRFIHAHSADLAAHRRAMGELFAPLTRIAAANAYAAFPTARTPDWLATPSADNYPVAYPYLKWHVAQDAVNQGAAVLLMSETAARAAGLADGPANLTYVLGGADASDVHLSDRQDIASADAMQHAVAAALDATGMDPATLSTLDLYSCFPCAVWCGLAALAMPAPAMPAPAMPAPAMSTPARLPSAPLSVTGLSVTGGLPFFGGPGNAYSLHAIAATHDRLAGTAATGLVLANGGWLSKASVGLYSGAPGAFAPVPPAHAVTLRRPRIRQSCTGELEAFTFTHARDGSPRSGTALVRVRHTDRALAVATGDALARLARDPSPIGAPVRVDVRDGIGHLAFTRAG